MPRQIPQVFLVIEALRIEHVISAVDLRLHAEQHFGITRVRPQIRRHFRFGAEQLREQALVGADQRIVGREDVEMRFAVVGVHRGLHGVADVIDAPQISQIDGARIGMRIGCRIAIHHPHQAARIGDHQVGVGIPFEESGQLLQALAHPAANHHAAVWREVIGQQNVRLGLVNGRGDAHRERDRWEIRPCLRISSGRYRRPMGN